MKVREQKHLPQHKIPTKVIEKCPLISIELDETLQGAVEVKKRRIILKVPYWDLERALKQYVNKNPKIL